MIKYTWLKLVRKITLISTILLLVFSTISCTNNQENSPQVEVTETPAPATTSSNEELPATVQSAVLSDATKRVSKPVAALRITQTQKESWGDSCLGLAESGKLCAQVIVPGWKVVVSDGQREFVYRTDEKGNQVKLEELQK
ncbi:MAG: hypothetical protein WBA07_02550 [Rivularia sp. (in: cyanobacteria)]